MPTQHCPICRESVAPSARYPRYVCADCIGLAQAPDGRLVEAGNADIWGGIQLRYRDTGEPRDGVKLFIRGIECEASEARFGGVVVQAIKSDRKASQPTELLRTNRQSEA